MDERDTEVALLRHQLEQAKNAEKASDRLLKLFIWIPIIGFLAYAVIGHWLSP